MHVAFYAPLKPPNHLRGLSVRSMPRLGGGTGAGAELAIAGVAEPGHDISTLVEVRVERGNVDVDIGVRIPQGTDALGAAISDTCLTRAAPHALRMSIVAAAEPPVASIGSSTRQT